MSLTSGPINETEAAGEKFVDHLDLNLINNLSQAINVLTQYQIELHLTINFTKK